MHLLLMVLIPCCIVGAAEGASKDAWPELSNNIWIGHGRITMPIGRICLIRINSSHCAVRFVKAYPGKDEAEYFASYESWYQGDGSGDFQKSNVVSTTDDLSWKRPIGFGRLWLIQRFHDKIRCGANILEWLPRTSIYVPKDLEADPRFAVRFAPTIWQSIGQVDIHDPRIRWYEPGKSDDRAPDIDFPFDQLWEKSP